MINLQTAVPAYHQHQTPKRVAFKGNDSSDFLTSIDQDGLKAEQAKLKNFAEEEGTPKPIAKIAKFVASAVGVVITAAATRMCLNKSVDVVKGFVKSKPVQDIAQKADELVKNSKKPLSDVADSAMNGIKEGSKKAGEFVDETAQKISEKAKPVMDKISEKVKPMTDKVSELFASLKETKFGKFMNKIAESAPVKAVVGFVKEAYGKVAEFVGKAFGRAKTVTSSAYDKGAETISKIKGKNVQEVAVDTVAVGSGAAVALTEAGLVEKDPEQDDIVKTIVNAAAGGV